MAQTERGIKYPYGEDYDEKADIPEDMKEMAESIDKALEDVEEKIKNYDDSELRGRIESTEEAIEAIEQEQASQDTSIESLQSRVTELEEENEELKDNEITNTPDIATSLYLTDSAKARFRKLIPIGRTTQESTKGDNLISSENIDITISGVTYKSQIDGTILANGTKYGGNYANFSNNTVTLEEDTYSSRIFLLEGTISRDGSNIKPEIHLINQDDNTKSYNISEIGNPGKTRNIEAGTYFIRIALWNDNVVFTNAKIGIMLVKGSTIPTEFEKFTNGPSPNPNYPQDIKNTGDNVNLISEWQQGFWGTADGSYNETRNDYICTKKILVTPNTNYIYTHGLGNSTIYVMEYDKNNNYLGYKHLDYTTKLAFTTKENTQYVGIDVTKYTTITPGDMVEGQLKKGVYVTPYSPYGCGNVNEKVQSKNLLASENINVKVAGVTYKSQEDGTILANGEKYGGAYVRLNTITLEEGTYSSKQFLLSGSMKKNGNDVKPTVYLAKEDLSETYNIGEIGNPGISNTIPAGTYFIRIAVWSDNVVFTNAKIGFMLVKGSTIPDEFIPHEEQTLSFPLAQGQKLMEGDYPDDDEKVHHKMGEIVLDGSDDENWELNGVHQGYKLPINNIGGNTSQMLVSNILCNKLKAVSQSDIFNGNVNNGIASLGGVAIYIRIDETITTIALLRTYLSNNNLTVQFPLAEEITEDFTEEQKEAWQEWKKARTYKNVTHISSEDETPANLEAEYVVDTKTYIDNEISNMKTAIVALGGVV